MQKFSAQILVTMVADIVFTGLRDKWRLVLSSTALKTKKVIHYLN